MVCYFQKYRLICVVGKSAPYGEITRRGLALIWRPQDEKTLHSRGDARGRKRNQAQAPGRHVKQRVDKRTGESRRIFEKSLRHKSNRFSGVYVDRQKISFPELSEPKYAVRERRSSRPGRATPHIGIHDNPPYKLRTRSRLPRVSRKQLNHVLQEFGAVCF